MSELSLVYTLCMRRRGNRNKGLPGYIAQLGLTGPQQTALTASGMVIDGRGIITVLGTNNTSLSTADALYISNPIADNRPIQRLMVGALPLAIATFRVNTATNLDGDGTWRLQKILQTLNCQDEQAEPYTQMHQDVVASFVGAKGISSFSALASSGFGYGGAATVIGTTNERLFKVYFVNQLSGTTASSGNAGQNSGKHTIRYEYFVTNK